MSTPEGPGLASRALCRLGLCRPKRSAGSDARESAQNAAPPGRLGRSLRFHASGQRVRAPSSAVCQSVNSSSNRVRWPSTGLVGQPAAGSDRHELRQGKPARSTDEQRGRRETAGSSRVVHISSGSFRTRSRRTPIAASSRRTPGAGCAPAGDRRRGSAAARPPDPDALGPAVPTRSDASRCSWSWRFESRAASA